MTLPKVRRALELIVKPKPVSTLLSPEKGGGRRGDDVKVDPM
jgi:hypothetical protein